MPIETDDSRRDAIIAKIQKLRAMTIEAGASEAEAAMAAKTIAKLMLEWDITQDEASIRREAARCLRDHFHVMASSPTEYRLCSMAIEELFSVRLWYTKVQEDFLGLGRPQSMVRVNFFGLPADVAAAVSLMEIIQLSLLSESVAAGKGKRRSQDKDRFLESFRFGMARRIKDRIHDLIPAPTLSTGTGLMVLKDQLVTEEFAKLGLNLSVKGAGPKKALDLLGYAKGREAGNRLDLGQAKVGTGLKALTG